MKIRTVFIRIQDALFLKIWIVLCSGEGYKIYKTSLQVYFSMKISILKNDAIFIKKMIIFQIIRGDSIKKPHQLQHQHHLRLTNDTSVAKACELFKMKYDNKITLHQRHLTFISFQLCKVEILYVIFLSTSPSWSMSNVPASPSIIACLFYVMLFLSVCVISGTRETQIPDGFSFL